MLLRRVLRRHLVRVSIETEVLRRVLRRGVLQKALRRRLEGRNTPFRRVRPPSRAPYFLFPNPAKFPANFLWSLPTKKSRKFHRRASLQARRANKGKRNPKLRETKKKRKKKKMQKSKARWGNSLPLYLLASLFGGSNTRVSKRVC